METNHNQVLLMSRENLRLCGPGVSCLTTTMAALIRGNPFSVIEIGDSESEGMPEEQHGDVYIEPIYDDHHFEYVKERYSTTILFSNSTPGAKR